MTAREVGELADAISARYTSFEPDGSVRFGIEETVYAIAEVLGQDPTFDAVAFKHRCFSAAPPDEPSMGYVMGEDENPRRARGREEWNR